MAWTWRRVRLSSYRQQLGRGAAGDVSVRWEHSRERDVFAAGSDAKSSSIEACRIARVDEFALRFPEGYETIVGERGVKLSGRAAAADFDCAGDPGRPADSDSG